MAASAGSSSFGRNLLDSSEAGAECTRTTSGADLPISQRTTTAASYLGGFSLRQLAIAGGAEELASGALQRADAIFATTLPTWNATGF